MLDETRRSQQLRAGLRLAASLTLAGLYFVMAVGITLVEQDRLLADAVQPTPISNAPLAHIRSGRTLGYNLLLAGGLSILTTYFFLRRHIQEGQEN